MENLQLTEEEFNKIIAIRLQSNPDLTEEDNAKEHNELVSKIMLILIENTEIILKEQ